MLKADQICKLINPEAEDPLIVMPLHNLRKIKTSGSASIDLRLGSWFLNLRQARMECLHTDEKKTKQTKLAKTIFVPFGKDYILHPKSFVLGATLEWLRMPKNLGAYVIGKSSWGRRGLIIATATGVHPGFRGCLTLEISNVGEIPMTIKPGMKIGQLFLHEIKEPVSVYIERSSFFGMRKPSIGDVKPDIVAKKLAKKI